MATITVTLTKMLEQLIRLSLKSRLLMVATAASVLVWGLWIATQLPVDVLPNLTRPRVTVITECHGMAPEEVETRVTIPLEYALNGATDVVEVRSTSDIGLSIVQVEFDWGKEIFQARQIVQERLSTVGERLPSDVQPQLAPVASLLGQIMMIGVWSEDGTTDPLELRTQAEWVIGQRLRAIRGVAQVISMGGGRKQVQVLVDLHQMHKYEVTLEEVERALVSANLNVTGGFVNDGDQELLIRGLGRIEDPEKLGQIVVKSTPPRPVLLSEIARVQVAAQAKRGDSSVNGQPSIVLTIQKQPDSDTRQLTSDILAALDELRVSLPPDVRMQPTYQQREFIDLGIANVTSALRDGSLLVALVLFVFLLNLRTTVITLVVIPLSLVITAIVFHLMDMSINVMTLGGLAVGLGMLVDDAIVGVESAYRRLRQRLTADSTLSPSTVVFEATREVLGAIVVSTLLVIVVFAPLLMLSGMEGRLFTPLGIAYLVSICASTLVALTVTPALSLMLLPSSVNRTAEPRDSALVRILKFCFLPLVKLSLRPTGLLAALGIGVVACGWAVLATGQLGRDFLPAFDEGATQVNLYAAPGTSLDAMVRVSQAADQRFELLRKSPERPNAPLLDFTCRMGRAEEDEHVMGVNVAEYVMTLNPDSNVSRQEMIELLTKAVDDLPGVEHEIEQPIAHLISHMLSGVAAQIAIKIQGDDLETLRRKAQEVKAAIADIPGIAEPFVEQQQLVPQLRFELNYEALADYGVAARDVTDLIETAMQGRVVSQLTDGQRYFDILVRMDDEYRLALHELYRLPVELPDGRRVLLGSLAQIQRGGGPNTIQRENARRRIVIRVNTLGGDLSGVVEQIRQRISEQIELPTGYFIAYGGQFEARQSAEWRIMGFSVVSALLVMAILYSVFPSMRVVLQIVAAVPAAFVGGVAALVWTDQSLSIAALVGFVSLAGVATRNGLLLIGTYQDLAKEAPLTPDSIEQGSLERLAPVLMSSLTTGLGLMPLVIGGTQPGKEILYPVATVVVGGLVTSTLCEFLIRPGLYWWTLPEKIEPVRE